MGGSLEVPTDGSQVTHYLSPGQPRISYECLDEKTDKRSGLAMQSLQTDSTGIIMCKSMY